MKTHIMLREETQGGMEGISLNSHGDGAFQSQNSSHLSPPVSVVADCGVRSSKQ